MNWCRGVDLNTPMVTVFRVRRNQFGRDRYTVRIYKMVNIYGIVKVIYGCLGWPTTCTIRLITPFGDNITHWCG